MDQININGTTYRRVLIESLLKPYRSNRRLSDGGPSLKAEFDGEDWSAELVLQSMNGEPEADELILTIDAEGESSEYQLQSYELEDLKDTAKRISKILERHPDLDTVIDVPDRFDMEDITDRDSIFVYRLPE